VCLTSDDVGKLLGWVIYAVLVYFVIRRNESSPLAATLMVCFFNALFLAGRREENARAAEREDR
jgi:hypothetical protein